MSALDDALARARSAGQVPHQPTDGEVQEQANVVFRALLAETTSKLRSLNVPLLDAWRQQTSEYTFYGPARVARAWPLQVFMLTESGEAYPYSELRREPSPVDNSGRDHIYVGEGLSPTIVAMAANSPVAFRKASPTKLRYRPTFERTITETRALRDRFPRGDDPDYPLEDFLAHAILELLP